MGKLAIATGTALQIFKNDIFNPLEMYCFEIWKSVHIRIAGAVAMASASKITLFDS